MKRAFSWAVHVATKKTSGRKPNLEQNPLTIHLFSAPWPLFNRPSIQLGTLKAYLELKAAPVKVQAHHFYLNVAEALGYPVYQAISEKTWPSESVYAALLFPGMAQKAERLFMRECRKHPSLKKLDFTNLTQKVKSATDSYLDNLPLESPLLAGFSICLCQMTSSLYSIRRLKTRFPHLPIVVGGSNFAGPSARGLLEVFPEVDFVIVGEGELPLVSLAQALCHGDSHASAGSIGGVVSRAQGHFEGSQPPFHQLEDLTDLPMPDYSEYFQTLQGFEPQKRFFPTLLVEASRGCWWRKGESSGNFKGCAFCNLNLQWKGYRFKRPEKVVREANELTSRHQVLSLAFADNILPSGEKGELFRGLQGCGKDFRIFGEIRARTSHSALQAMRKSGLEEVQVGIESLSTSLLSKMNKGTTALDNLQIMRDCEELGIVSVSNLLLRFPASDEKDVEETLRTLEFAMPFRPLRRVFFWLGLGSPIHEDLESFGIRKAFNHPHYGQILPSNVVQRMRLMVQGYRGDHAVQKKLWHPVEKALRVWEKSYERLQEKDKKRPILSYRDGRDFLIITQRRWQEEPAVHRLTGASRAIYLYCTMHRALQDILTQFPRLHEDPVRSFLAMLVGKRLMYRENDRYLSLAVRAPSSPCGNFTGGKEPRGDHCSTS